MIANLTDQKLLQETKLSVKREKSLTFAVLKHLCEVYKRRLFLDFNYSSLQEYCTRELGYTSGEAQYRVATVKLMKASRKVEVAVKDGSLALSTAVVMHNHISANTDRASTESINRILEKVQGKSKREALEVLDNSKSVMPALPKRSRTTISLKTKELLKELVMISGEDEEKILNEALQEKIEKLKALEEKKLEQTSTQKSTKASSALQSRYIPSHIKAKVRKRGNYQCEFISNSGKRCKTFKKLQIDHITPYAAGGKNSEENLRLLCSRHNIREAIKFFGVRKMDPHLY